MTDIAEFDVARAGHRVTGHGLAAWFAESRELLRLAVPLAATQLAQMAIMGTDMFMLGHLSTAALASATLGNTIFFFSWLLGFGPASAVSPMIAHILGARPNDRHNVRAVARMGLWAVIIMSLPLITILQFAEPLLVMLGQERELAAGAGAFVAAVSLGLPFSLGYQVLRNYTTALSRPAAPLIVMGIAVVFNALADYALIFGHFGFPKLGLVGSGIASAVSFAFSFFAMLGVIWLTPNLRKYRILRRFRRPHWEKLGEVFRLGMPIGLTTIFEAMLFNMATLVMGTFGMATVAAHQISMLIPSFTFMVPLGVAMAATVRVGLAAGAGDGEAVKRAGYSALIVGAGFMVIMALVLLAWPAEIAGLWLADSAQKAEVIAIAVVFLHFAAAFQVVDGLQVIGSLSLRGLKDARAPMWLAAASYWLVGAPAALFFAFGLGLKGTGIWMGLSLALFVAAVLMCWRFWYLTRTR